MMPLRRLLGGVLLFKSALVDPFSIEISLGYPHLSAARQELFTAPWSMNATFELLREDKCKNRRQRQWRIR